MLDLSGTPDQVLERVGNLAGMVKVSAVAAARQQQHAFR